MSAARDPATGSLCPNLDLGGTSLRPLHASDVDALLAYLQDPDVTARTSFPEMSRAFAQTMIDRSTSRWAAGDLGRWALVSPDDQLIGTCGFSDGSPTHRWAELAFDLARSHWGNGRMRPAITAVVDWAFQTDRLDRVHAFVRVDNLASERTLLACGFVREGRMRSFRICRGHRHDFTVYARLREAGWPSVPAGP